MKGIFTLLDRVGKKGSCSPYIGSRAPSGVQLSLFEDKAELSAISLTKLAAGLHPALNICISRRLTRSWRVEWKASKGRLVVPAVTVCAPLRVKSALLDWAMLMKMKKRAWTRDQRVQKTVLEACITNFLLNPLRYWTRPADEEHELAFSIQQGFWKSRSRKLSRIQPRGKYHNLDKLLIKIMTAYNLHPLKARITWSSRIGAMSTHCIESDSHGDLYHLITISRCYDFPDVSEEILGGVVYHELLHAVFPPVIKNGRRLTHHLKFKRSERRYAYFKEWQEWHRNILPRKLALLQSRTRLEKSRK